MNFQNILGKISGVFSSEGALNDLGNLADRFIETGEEKREFQLEVQKWAHQKEMEMLKASTEAQEVLNKRVAEQEGTAKDLLQAGWLGRVILFLRGVQRPVWGFSTIYFVWQWYSGALPQTPENYRLTFILILLVGGFLFGERAIKNVAPVIKDMLLARAEAKK